MVYLAFHVQKLIIQFYDTIAKNGIIYFVLSVKLENKKGFLQTPLKAYIFKVNHFHYVLQKKA